MAATTPCSLQVIPSNAPTLGNEFSFCGLYLYHTYGGPNANQVEIISRGQFGTLSVNNWVIRDGLSDSAKVIARARGLHVNASDWHNSFSLVFEDEGFKGSTLQVMGVPVEGGEWAIVGGTGRFAMATGVIKKRVHERNSEGNIIELTIQGFCPLLKASRSFVAIKIGPWGGCGGSARDIAEPPKRLESITICSGLVIDSIAFSYVDQAGQKHTAGPWGGPGGSPQTIELSDSEIVKEVSGTFGISLYAGFVSVISSIKLVTNVKTYGPFGQDNGIVTSFSVPVQGNSGVAGFFGRSGKFLNAIGVYVHPLS